MRSWWSLLMNACRLAPLLVVTAWAQPAVAAKIACVGDSITYGYGLSNPSQQSYPAVLQTLLGTKHTVQNFGATGCTLLKRGDQPYWNDANFAASDAFKPDVVVVMLGTNDAKPQNWAYKADFASDYGSLIDHYRALGALVYVAVPPPVYPPGAYSIDPNVLSGEVVPLIRQIAASANAPLIDVFQALSGKASDFPDTVHPNVEGSQLIAQTVATALQAGGFGGTGGGAGMGGSTTTQATASGGISGTGGTAKGTGGSSGTGGSTSTGGSSTATGGILGTGGSTKGTGGVSGTGGASTIGRGGTTGTGGSTKGSGGSTTGSGGVLGSGGVSGTTSSGGTSTGGMWGMGGASGTGGAGAQGGQAGGSNGAAGGAAGGSGGATGSSALSSGGSTGTGGGQTGTGGSSVNQTGKSGGCGCLVLGGNPLPGCACLVALLVLAMARQRRR